MITITNKARDILEGKLVNNYLRIYVQGGGCSGMEYVFEFDERRNGDTIIENLVLIDSISKPYLEGSTLDYHTTIMGDSIVLINPNAKTTCGCGESFGV